MKFATKHLRAIIAPIRRVRKGVS